MLTLQQNRYDLPAGPLALPMACSDATAKRLLKHGPFGADLIRFPAGGQVADHTHTGDHILVVLSGEGWVDFEGTAHRLTHGVCYLIPNGARHGIRAETELSILAIANNHRDVCTENRLSLCESLTAKC